MRNHTPTSTDNTGFPSPEQPADSPPQAAHGGSDLLGKVNASSVIIGVGALCAVLGTLSLVIQQIWSIVAGGSREEKTEPQEKVMNDSAGHTLVAPQNPGGGRGNELISRIRAKQADVKRYLRAVGARRNRLLTLTIVAAAISTLLTGPIALGGQPLANWLAATFELTSPVWRILCALAALCSLTAAVATQLVTSKNNEERITCAQEINATLEMLEVAITLNHLNQQEATSQYLKILEKCPFIETARWS